MKEEYYFVLENTNRTRIKFLIIFSVFTIILIGLFMAFWTSINDAIYNPEKFTSIKAFFSNEINEFTPTGLFYSGFFGGLFFIPLPHEVFFYMGLKKGNDIILSLIMINAGFFLSQAVNYLCGRKLNKFLMNFISKKKLYEARRKMNKYGGVSIIVFNILPLPAPLLNFALGITRYNVYRLAAYTILGNIPKYLAIILFFKFIN